MKTPEGTIQGPICSPADTTPRALQEAVEGSASPNLKGSSTSESTMKRTPQPTLTQSKLTSLLQPRNGPQEVPGQPVGNARPTMLLEAVEMDTSSAPVTQGTGGTGTGAAIGQGMGTVVTTDFLLKALKENTDPLLKSFNASLGALSHRIDDNSARISANANTISQQAATASVQQEAIEKLNDRVSVLERSGKAGDRRGVPERRAALSPEFLLARRSVRLWPVDGDCKDALWENVGIFLHETLAIREADLGQEDIELITRDVEGREQTERREVIVRFYEKQKRDMVMTSSAPALANKVDREGKPTAGIRLEVPAELGDTFRLLSRFGTRLRARHGAGTKRHIKFDDFCGSMYANVKLPGDLNWTRITPEMAREDMAASLREENVLTQKRLASKLVPGPRERLSRPLPEIRAATGPVRIAGSDPSVAGPLGKRPRWSVPDWGRHT